MRAGLVLSLGLGGALLAAGAAPHPGASGGVRGAWQFQTAPYDGGCVMTGDLIVRGDAKSGYICRLVAHEACPEITVTAQQTCRLTEERGAVTIKSRLERVTVPNYAPDNFALRMESAARMTGQLRSADIAPVTFFRGPGAIS